jgi:hypothetical protein
MDRGTATQRCEICAGTIERRYSSHPDYRRWEEAELFAGLRKAGIPEE